jgi:hypothetical protein
MTTLMDDLSRLRAEIAQLWAKYNSGEMDLAAVSVATNTAIELARTLQAEIQPLLDNHMGTSLFHQAYFAAVCLDVGIDIWDKKEWNDDYNFAAYDIADALFMNAHNAVLLFTTNNFLDDKDITWYNGKWGRFDETNIHANLTN